MTWLDLTVVVVMIIFIALGARMGSLWTGACLFGGFFGAFLVEYYALPMSEMIGGFAGAHLVASVLLFAGGVIVALVPGWILTRVTHAMFLGLVDSVMGLLTGFLAGAVAITLALLFILPHAPSVEKSSVWKRSVIVKPLHHFLEDLFNDSRFQKHSATEQLEDDFVKDFTPAFKQTEKSIKNTADDLVDKIKKK